MSKVNNIINCVIAAHEAFNNSDPKVQAAGAKLIHDALTHPDAHILISALEDTVQQISANEALEDLDRMGDDPSVSGVDEVESDVPEAEDEDGDGVPDENSDAASPADEGLVKGNDEPEDDNDVTNDASQEVEDAETGSVSLIKTHYSVSANIRHAAQMLRDRKPK